MRLDYRPYVTELTNRDRLAVLRPNAGRLQHVEDQSLTVQLQAAGDDFQGSHSVLC